MGDHEMSSENIVAIAWGPALIGQFVTPMENPSTSNLKLTVLLQVLWYPPGLVYDWLDKMFLFISFSTSLYGVTLCQTIFYYRNFSNDKYLKILVSFAAYIRYLF